MSKVSQDKQKQLEEIVKKQEQELLELKANNNKYKALQTNIAIMWKEEILMSVEEVWVILWMTRNKLFQKMRYKRLLKKDNAPYKHYDWEYFVQKEIKYKKWKSKIMWKYMQTFILPKWLELLKATFLKPQTL